MRYLTTPNRRDSLWDFMSEVEKAFDQAWSNAPTASPSASFTPAVDLHETADNYIISVDLPGIDQKDVKIEVDQGRLTVSGTRNREESKEDGHFRRFERSYGSFVRTFQLPQNVDDTKIQARSENGVLEILVPKAEVAKPRSVAIETGKGGLFSRLIGEKKTVEEKH